MGTNQLKQNGVGVLPELKRVASVVGSLASLAEAINANRSLMYGWRQVPDELVIPMEKAQRAAIRRAEARLRAMKKNFMGRHKIRPDLYSKAKDKKQ